MSSRSNELQQVPDLAIALTAFNSMRTIDRAMQSIAGLGGRIVVIDSGSTDGTIELCRSYGADVIYRAWGGNVIQKRFAIDHCREFKWTLVLDSDESLSAELRESIVQTLRNAPDCAGWLLNRKVFFLDGWLHHTFQPEWRLRLVRTSAARVEGREPHDHLEVDGQIGRLNGDLRHDSWADLKDMLIRYVNYGRTSADQGARGGTLGHLLFNPPAAMFKHLIIKQGFRDGWRGVIACGGAGAGVLIKHLFIAQRRAQLQPPQIQTSASAQAKS